MVEAELLVLRLRSQVRELQGLLNYLESRDGIAQEEYSYMHVRLQEAVGRLKEMEQFSGQRAQTYRLHAQWLN